MKKNKILTMLSGMLIFMVCLFCFESIHAQAKASNNNNMQISTTAGEFIHNNEKTGIKELDDSTERGTKVLEALTKTFGFACGLVGIVVAALGFFGHQEELKAKAPMIIFVGVIIYFAKEIFNFLVGK